MAQEITIGVQEPITEYPDGRHSGGGDWKIYNLMFDPLMRVDENGQPIPALATSYERIDPTTWRFHLREGVTFHNGEEFDAQDVKATWDYDLNPDNNYMNYSRVKFITEVKVVDKYTVDFITDGEPNAAFFVPFTVFFIRPDEYFAKVGLEGFQEAPVGTGPFKFVEWQRDEYILFEGFKDYWGGAPKLDTVRLVFMPEEATRMAALEAGEIDAAERIGPEQIGRLEEKGFVVQPILIGRAEEIFMGQDKTRPEPLRDKRVRQAMYYAIDVDAIVDGLSLGYARKMEGQVVGPDAVGYDPNIKAYPYDPDKAKALLAEAGYADGFDIRVPFSPRGFRSQEVFESVCAYWAQVGINCDIEIMEFSVWAQPYLKGEAEGIFSQATNYMPSLDIDYILGTLDVRYCWQAPEYLELLHEERAALDPDEREQVLWKIAEYLHDELPIIPLFQIPDIWCLSPKVHDFVEKPDSFFYLNDTYVE
jgi:peptide/nickel transport system substrate-binding protein